MVQVLSSPLPIHVDNTFFDCSLPFLFIYNFFAYVDNNLVINPSMFKDHHAKCYLDLLDHLKQF